MFKIIDERDSGKTRKLLTECADNNGLYVCKHPYRVADKCFAYGLPKVEAIGYDEYEKILTTKRPVYIDELECFIVKVFPQIKGYCMSKED